MLLKRILRGLTTYQQAHISKLHISKPISASYISASYISASYISASPYQQGMLADMVRLTYNK